MPKFEIKNVWFGYFWPGIWKKYCQIWNQHRSICLIAKFWEKSKIPKFGTKNAWFGNFLAEIWKQYCHIWNKHPQISTNVKFCEETKITKFGIKNALFWSFWARILKSYRHIRNQPPRLCQKWVINSYSEVLYRVRSSKIQGSLFLKIRVRVRVLFINYASRTSEINLLTPFTT